MKKSKLRSVLFIILSLTILACNNQAPVQVKEEQEIINVKSLLDREILEIENLRAKKEQEKLRDDEYEATLLAVGDIMFHSPQLDAALNPDKTYSFMDTFRYLRNILSQGYSIANFESTIAESGFSGYPAFRTPASSMQALRFVGFDMLALANNHTLDGGVKGIIRTNETAHQLGFDVVGTYTSEDTRPKIVNIKGRDLAFLNYTYGLNGLDRYIEGK